MYIGASLLMYFGSEPQRCIALSAILDNCTHICYIYEKITYLCINGLDSYVCT